MGRMLLAAAAVAVVALFVSFNTSQSIEEHPRVMQWVTGEGSGYYNYNGHPVFVKTLGLDDDQTPAKPVLLLLHGFPTSSFDWFSLWTPLSHSFRLVTLDFCGAGMSFKDRDQDLSIMNNADIVDSLMLSLGLSEYHILAHDYGDSVAQELLARHSWGKPNPHLPTPNVTIHSCVLLNGGILPGQHRPLLTQWLLGSEWFGPIFRHAVIRPMFDRSFSKVFGVDTKPSSGDLDEHWALVSKNCGTCVVDKVLGYMHERLRFKERWENALFETRAKVLLVNGPADPVSGAHVARAYKLELRNRRIQSQRDVVMLDDDVGHYPQLEATAAVYNAIIAFHNLQNVAPMFNK